MRARRGRMAWHWADLARRIAEGESLVRVKGEYPTRTRRSRPRANHLHKRTTLPEVGTRNRQGDQCVARTCSLNNTLPCPICRFVADDDQAVEQLEMMIQPRVD